MKEKEKQIRPYRVVSVWTACTALLTALMIAVNIIVPQNLSGLMDVVFGGPRPIYDDSFPTMYTSDITDKDQALAHAQAVNLKLAEEGFVLLKNTDSALPLNDGAKISVFGKNSVNLSYGGSGSGGFDTSNNRDLYASLDSAGFQINPELKAFYEGSASGAVRSANSSDLDSGSNQKIATAETPQAKYTDKVKQSYSKYNDAAIVVITRIGGEGFDLPRYQGNTEGAIAPDSHYLQLDQNEMDLLAAVTDGKIGRAHV